MKTRPTRPATSIAMGQRRPMGIWMTACLAIVLNSMPGSWAPVHAAPPTAADDIDYAASGFQLPSGVNQTAWATAAGVSAAGGMNFASQPAISGPMMAPPMAMNGMPGNGPVMPRSPLLSQRPSMPQAMHPGMSQAMHPAMMARPKGPRPPGALPIGGPSMGAMGSPASMMAMGMPGMGPNGPVMGRPGMEGPLMGPSQMAGQMPGTSSIPSSFPSGPVPGMGGVVPTGLQAPLGPNAYHAAMSSPYGQSPYGVMPVGFCGQSSSCDGMCGDAGCGAYASAGYGNCGCDGSCDSGCGGGRKFNGLLSLFSKTCNQCNGYGCQNCAQKSLQNDCIGYGGLFGDLVNGSCLDGDLGLMLGGICSNLSMLSDCLSPYAEAGKCSQRWFDFSAEYMALSSNLGQSNQVFTTLGVNGDPVLSLSDVDADGLASGVRLSAAVILGVGGNLEVTYMGGHEWDNTASTALAVANIGQFDDSGPANAAPVNFITNPQDLFFSYLSNFGSDPGAQAGSFVPAVPANPAANPPVAGNPDMNVAPSPGGFDDSDASIRQSLRASSRFHSGELNYRRRIVGPYCKFQGSWLAGMRYLRFDNDLTYSAVGTLDNGTAGALGHYASNGQLRFFESDVQTKNDYFGAQLGYDFWWNVTPGVHFGVEMKGAWMQNDWERQIAITANSAGIGATPGDGAARDRDRLGTLMGELQTTLLYRFSHEWTFRSSYHLMGIEDVVGTTLTAESIRGGSGLGTSPLTTFGPAEFDTAVIQGFTVGMEYLW